MILHYVEAPWDCESASEHIFSEITHPPPTLKNKDNADLSITFIAPADPRPPEIDINEGYKMGTICIQI